MNAASLTSAAPTQLVPRFQAMFQSLRADTLDMLDDIYAPDIVFEDPLHRVAGLDALKSYFGRLYQGVESIGFEFEDVLDSGDQAMLTWTMHMRHRRLRPGEILALPGASHIRFGARVHYHRDYFDAGALLYERLPLLGGVVRAIRSRV
jgi:ketosteroid isomerase-like protein